MYRQPKALKIPHNKTTEDYDTEKTIFVAQIVKLEKIGHNFSNNVNVIKWKVASQNFLKVATEFLYNYKSRQVKNFYTDMGHHAINTYYHILQFAQWKTLYPQWYKQATDLIESIRSQFETQIDYIKNIEKQLDKIFPPHPIVY